MINQTPFPTRPTHVVPLAAEEFALDTNLIDAASLDAVCARFVNDANRALVWLIRFQALKTLSERSDMAEWFRNETRTPRVVCEVAARFELNDRWEFDRDRFCSAVDAVVSRRSTSRPA
jgi:hypothetical protein